MIEKQNKTLQKSEFLNSKSLLSSSSPDPFQVISRCLPGHMNLHLSQKLSGTGADSVFATYHPRTHH